MEGRFIFGQGVWATLQSISATEAVSYVSEYMDQDDEGRPRYTGRGFELVGGSIQEPMRLTAEDIVAVSMLSVNVPASAAWQLLTRFDGEISSLLHQIPVDLMIETGNCDYEATYGAESALQRLWNVVRHGTDYGGKKWGIGPTIASKILARKRPALVPVQDEVVVRVLNLADKNFWKAWWEAMHLEIDGRRPVVEFAQLVRSEAGASHLSLLRTLDVVLWRHGIGKP